MKLTLILLLTLIALPVHAENLIIKFYADWCPPCKQIVPSVKYVSNKLNIRVKEVNLDTDIGLAIANRLGIQGIPALLVIKDGKEVCRILGYLNEAALLEKVNQCLKIHPVLSLMVGKNESHMNTSKTYVG